jgi:parallel beta-helix repeat protein
VQANVRDYGAVGDGVHLDTGALQAAVDWCAAQGGGTIVVPAGTYLIGTVCLRSNLTLYLAPDATLLGSRDLCDYSTDTQSGFLFNSRVPLWDKCLIYAQGARNVAITGQGTVNGQGRFFPRQDQTETGTVHLERPMLVRFKDCENVTLRDVTLRDSACWCANLIHCRNVKIGGMTIDSRVNATNDGIDLEDCHRVTISNCDIRSFDDAIALKDSATDVVITNCILSSYCAALRLGPESVGVFENIAVSNCVIRDTFHCGVKLQMCEGGRMEDVIFSDLVMENVTGPISVRLARWLNEWMPEERRRQAFTPGILRNVMISNIRARVTGGFTPIYDAAEDQDLHELELSYMSAFLRYGAAISSISVTGLPGYPVEGLTLHNIHVTYPGGGTAQDAARTDVPDLDGAYPEYYMFGVLPAYGLYAHHTKGLVMSDVHFDLAASDLRPAVVCDDVADSHLSGLRAAASSSTGSLIRLQRSRRVSIHGSQPLNDVATFVRLDGTERAQVTLMANDLSRVGTAIELSSDARGD